jgi:heme/copper-type cytochrome/quinol oxidase subunit 1
MPRLTRWFIKSSLIFFLAALLSGLIMAARPTLNLPAWVSVFGPVYFHMFLVGWVTQLIFGVVFWMFPKFSMEQPRGSEFLGWATFGLLNIGLLMRVVGEPLLSLRPGSGEGWLLAVSALLQWAAGLTFVWNTWSRVKEK